MALLRRTPSVDSGSATGWGLRNAEPSARGSRLNQGVGLNKNQTGHAEHCQNVSERGPCPLRAAPACSTGLALENSLEESFLIPATILWMAFADEFVCGRLLAVDPALPECLGGTVILLGKMRTWCEVEHAVKGKHGEGGQQPSKSGIQRHFNLQKFT